MYPLPCIILFILIAVVILVSLETLIKMAIILGLIMFFVKGTRRFDHFEHNREYVKAKRSPYV